MNLKLERCTIRDWRMDDAESLSKHANNRRIWVMVRDRFPHPYTINDARDFIALKSAAGRLAELVSNRAKMSIDVLPKSVTGSAKNSGAKAS